MSDAVRVLVVDDSPFMRRAIIRMLEKDAAIKVVGTASDGQQALASIKELHPDVVTLDIEMPVLDGLSTLKEVMRTSRVPVVMMSSLTQEGSVAALEALDLGAFDFVPKPESSVLDVFQVGQELLSKVLAAAARHPAPISPTPKQSLAHYTPPDHVALIAIGVSTGGPGALKEVLPRLPANFPIPVAVVQHMPIGFTRSLAERLNSLCPLSVHEAEPGEAVVAGKILIAPAGRNMRIKRHGGSRVVELLPDDTGSWHRPSVDALFESVAETYGNQALGVIMTGLGNDGTTGAGAMHQAGATIWGQDAASCVVYGMPRAAYESGVVSRVLPLVEIGPSIASLATRVVPHH